MRKNITITICIYLTLSLIATSPVFSEEAKGDLSLAETLQIAFAQNPRVAIARREAEAAKGRWVQARAYPNPEVEVESSEISEGIRSGSTVGEDAVSVSQEVDLFGKISLRSGASGKEWEAAQLQVHQTWLEVAFEVTRAYNTLLLNTQRLELSRETLELTRRFLDRIQLRYNAGEVLRNELLRAKIEVANAENTLLEAQKELTLAKADLNLLLGREAQRPLTPSDELRYEEKELDAGRLMEAALAKRPDLKIRDALLQARRKEVQLALRDVIENPTLSAIGTREGGEEVFGLAVSWPFPFWNRNQGNIQEARANLEKSKTEKNAVALQIGLEVTNAVSEAQLAQRQVAVWKEAIEQANELMQLAMLQYGEGEIDFITYLEHLTTVKETKVNYVEALANYQDRLALVHKVIAASLDPFMLTEEKP